MISGVCVRRSHILERMSSSATYMFFHKEQDGYSKQHIGILVRATIAVVCVLSACHVPPKSIFVCGMRLLIVDLKCECSKVPANELYNPIHGHFISSSCASHNNHNKLLARAQDCSLDPVPRCPAAPATIAPLAHISRV